MRRPFTVPWAWPYLACAAAACLAGAVAAENNPATFARYLGGAAPPFMLVATGIVGLVALAALRVDAPFSRGKPMTGARAWRIAAVVALFAAAAITADMTLRFPREISVTGASAPLFYVAMGFLAAVGFHVAPLAILITAFRARGPVLWGCIVLTALIEPVFQLRAAIAAGAFTALDLFVFAQVFAFGLFELYLLRRHGFVWMYATRLAYYLAWHVLWGAARLPLLFG